jgi:hypothetical protein
MSTVKPTSNVVGPGGGPGGSEQTIVAPEDTEEVTES